MGLRPGWRAVLAAGFWLAAFLGARAEGRFALVIGNDHYVNLDHDRQLQKAANDASAVGDALERDGFTVLRGTDLTRAAMVDRLYDLSARLHPGDTALFYFAGHGVALGSGNFLLPSDVPDIDAGQEMRLANQAVAEADVIATFQDKGVRVAIMVLDACRDNPFRRPGLRSVGQERGFGHMPEANGVFSLYSAGYGQSALDRLSDTDANPNSVFTRVLVPLLTRPGLNLDDLAFDVREDVAKLAAATPDHHVQIPAAYNQIIGGRVFLAPSTGPQVPSGPTAGTGSDKVAVPITTANAVPEPVPAVEPSIADEPGLAGLAQAELNRLGCDAGPVTGTWNDRSRHAMLRLARTKDLSVNVDVPDAGSLGLLRGLASGCSLGEDARPGRPDHPSSRAEVGRRVVRRVAQQVEPRRQERNAVRSIASPSRGSGGCFSFNGQRICD